MASTSWSRYRIKEIGRVVTGKTPPAENPEYFGNTVLFLTPTDMDGRRLIDHTERYLSPEGAKAFQRILAPYGVAVSCIGWQMGKSALLNQPFVTNQQINAIVPDESKTDRLFLYYAMSLRRTEIFNLGAGGSRTPILKKSAFEDLLISVPPLLEQRAISYVLGTLDDKIELNRRMNETLEAMAQAIFKSWFVDFDPVRVKAEGRKPFGVETATAALFPDRFQDCQFGEIPCGWERATAGDLCERILDKIDEPSEWASQPLIDLSRMPQRSIALTDWGLGEELTTSVTRFRTMDTLFGAIRPYFHKVGIAPMDGVTNVSVFVLRARHAIDWPYLATLCSLPTTVEFATRVAKGTKMPVVAWPDLAAYEIVLPPRQVREAFASIVGALYKRIIANIHESRTLAALRDALLPKLLSGEIRAKDAEKFVGKMA